MTAALDLTPAVVSDRWMANWTGSAHRGSAYAARHVDFLLLAALTALQAFLLRPSTVEAAAGRGVLNVSLLLLSVWWIATRAPSKRDEPWKHGIKIGSRLVRALAAVLGCWGTPASRTTSVLVLPALLPMMMPSRQHWPLSVASPLLSLQAVFCWCCCWRGRVLPVVSQSGVSSVGMLQQLPPLGAPACSVLQLTCLGQAMQSQTLETQSLNLLLLCSPRAAAAKGRLSFSQSALVGGSLAGQGKVTLAAGSSRTH